MLYVSGLVQISASTAISISKKTRYILLIVLDLWNEIEDSFFRVIVFVVEVEVMLI